jgi:hypothetical protein
MRISAFALLVTLAAACNRGDHDKCESACRNFGTLVFWKNKDAEIAKLPESQRALARQKALGKFDNDMENGVDDCTTQCQSANNTEQIDCMIAAKTPEQADACVK